MPGIEKLLSSEGLALLQQVESVAESQSSLKLIDELRKSGHDPELISQVLTQAKLRNKAKAKFGEFANQLLYTQDGLEQATRLGVAAHHAGIFRAAGVNSITDLGCGIGSDALAFAAAGFEVTAVERDIETAAIASFNLAVFENAKVLAEDASQVELTSQALWFDPARRDLEHRGEKHKVVRPEDFSPSLNWVFQTARTRISGVKLGPAFPKELIPDDAKAIWVTHNRDLVELTLWFGFDQLAKFNVLQIAEESHTFSADEILNAEVGELRAYLYEPDAGLIRSGLMGNLAKELGIHTVSPGIAYLSSDQVIDSPWLRGYEVLEVLNLDEKKIAAWCKERGVGVLEIKKRGVDITPEQLRPKLKLKGAGTATLILTKIGDARRALFCKPIR